MGFHWDNKKEKKSNWTSKKPTALFDPYRTACCMNGGHADGPGGNRTRVRKPVHPSVSHHSIRIDIPSDLRPDTGSGHQ